MTNIIKTFQKEYYAYNIVLKLREFSLMTSNIFKLTWPIFMVVLNMTQNTKICLFWKKSAVN